MALTDTAFPCNTLTGRNDNESRLTTLRRDEPHFREDDKMKMNMKRNLLMTVAFLATAQMASAAAVTAEELAARFQAEGYSFIEIRQGATQIKIEAIKDGVKTEIIFDILTGAILKSESERVGTIGSSDPGIQISVIDRDFLDDEDEDELEDEYEDLEDYFNDVEDEEDYEEVVDDEEDDELEDEVEDEVEDEADDEADDEEDDEDESED